MSIKYGNSKKQYVQGERVANLEIFVDTDKVKVYYDEYDKNEPSYYDKDGLSPLQSFEEGLISKEEYLGFIKGNIIKYIIRCDKKFDTLGDLEKARDYLNHLINCYRNEQEFIECAFNDYIKGALKDDYTNI